MPSTQTALQKISENLEAVKAKIMATSTDVGRNPESVNLVAVSKTHEIDHIRPALVAGHRIFGENRVQEAAEKWPILREEFPDLQLHLIGPLQSNKVKKAIGLFDVIETVDRPKLARALAREMADLSRRPSCFIQVNTGEEEQKAGVKPSQVDEFITLCRDELDLPIIGLMCIPPQGEEPGMHFGLLAEMAKRNNLTGLSMGMSSDFETAVRFGATHVRVGTAIFGTRPPFRPAGE
jgi:PLP dependent protein